MVFVNFAYRLLNFLVVLLFAIICVFGVLTNFPFTDRWVERTFEPLTIWQARGLYLIGLFGVIALLICWLVRLKASVQARRSSAVKIQEEGGTTWILESAINRYLQSMLHEIEGVESTNTTTAMSHNGAVTVEINVLSKGVKSRPELTRQIREITRKALVTKMGIPNVEGIHIIHQDYKFVESALDDLTAPTPAIAAPAAAEEPVQAEEPQETEQVDGELVEEEEPESKSGGFGWFKKKPAAEETAEPSEEPVASGAETEEPTDEPPQEDEETDEEKKNY